MILNRAGTFYTNYLFTENEVFTGKSQTTVLPYWPSDSEVNTARPKFSRKDKRSRLTSCLLHGFLLSFSRPVINPRALRENNALELANQSAFCISYKHKPFDNVE